MHAMAHMWRSDLSRCAGPQALVEPPPKDLSTTDATLEASLRPWSSAWRLQHLSTRNKG